MPLSNEEIIRIDLALEATGGNRARALAVLDMTKVQLNDAIRNHSQLSEKWSQPRGPVGAPSIAQTVVMNFPIARPGDESLMVARVQEENALLRGALVEKLGLTAEDAQEAAGLIQYHRAHSLDVIDLFGASLTKRGVALSRIARQLEEELQGEDFKAYNVVNEMGQLMRHGREVLVDLLLRCHAEIRKMLETVSRAQSDKAKRVLWENAMKRAQDGPGGAPGVGGRRRRPGFGNLERPTVAIKAEAGASVTVHEAGNQES